MIVFGSFREFLLSDVFFVVIVVFFFFRMFWRSLEAAGL